MSDSWAESDPEAIERRPWVDSHVCTIRRDIRQDGICGFYAACSCGWDSESCDSRGEALGLFDAHREVQSW